MSRVTCHMSLTPTATAIHPPPANSPTMHSRLFQKDPTTRKSSKQEKSSKLQEPNYIYSCANISDTLFDHKSQTLIARAKSTIMGDGTDGQCD